MDDCREMFKNFIHHLYNPEESYSKFPIPKEYLELFKSLIGNIVKMLSEIKNNDSVVVSQINCICDNLKYYPDRQIFKMYEVYNSLLKTINDSETLLENFINFVIGYQKETIFLYAVRPKLHLQNLHVLNDWKYELRNELGFNFDFKTSFETIEQDRFKNWPGNALKAFYSFFTPEYIIYELTE
jgi:hypothetical protein